MSSAKPLLLFDGDCGFCRTWVARWKHLTAGQVDYAAYQDAASSFSDIPRSEFARAVQLIEPDGRRTSAAEAVFRALRYGGHPSWLWAYERIPGFRLVSEFSYGVVAGHRPVFSTLTRWLWGAAAEPESYRMMRWIFLRALAIIYGVAFWSYSVQWRGLNGSQGILPAADLLQHLTSYGPKRFWFVPTLAWINTSDTFLVGLGVAGVLCAVFLFLNVAPRLLLFLLWVLYLSFVSIGGSFMNFQWDALLLEAGFLAIFFAPGGLLPGRRGALGPGGVSLFLLRWLLFRLMIQSAFVKWLSGDALWRSFQALTVHYQTQPLPNPLSWFIHQWPAWFHQFSCIGLFLIEGVLACFIFAPRRLRLVACAALLVLQGLILLTGNYAYFNALSIALCLTLVDDAVWRRYLPGFCQEAPVVDDSSPRWSRLRITLRACSLVLVLVLTLPSFLGTFRVRLPAWLNAPATFLSPWRSFNGYGLFAVMTPKRPEIVIEGSLDGREWKSYTFKYKPGDLSKRPRQVAPYQPRLDWQMWFAALGDYRQNPWFLGFCVRLLQGSAPVLALLADNPFPNEPPRVIRAGLYEYRFTTPAERKKSGHWWHKEFKGEYCPSLSLKRG